MGIFSFLDKETETEVNQEQTRDTSTATTETQTQTQRTTEELERVLKSQESGEQQQTQAGTTTGTLFGESDLANLRQLTDILSGSVGETAILPGVAAGAITDSLDIAGLVGEDAGNIPELINALTKASADQARSSFELAQQAQINTTAGNLGGRLSNSFVQQLQGLGQGELEASLAEQAARFRLQGVQLGAELRLGSADSLRAGGQAASGVRAQEVQNLLESFGLIRGAETTQQQDLSSILKSLTTGEKTEDVSSEQNVLSDLIRDLVSTSKERGTLEGTTTQTTSDPIGQITGLITALGTLKNP